MRRFKRASICTCAVALGFAFALGATACGGKSGGSTIRYAVWGSTDEIAIIDQIIEGFEALYADEGYKVEKVHYSSNYYNSIQLDYGAKNEADVFWMQGGTIESYIGDGLLLNLQPYIEAEYEDGLSFTEGDLWQINDAYRYNAETETMGNGDLYAVIKDWSPDFAMVYNKALIDQFDAETGAYAKIQGRVSAKERAESKLAEIAGNDAQYAALKGTKVVGRTLAEIVGYPTDESGKYPSETIPMSWLQNELMCFLLTTYNNDGIREIYGTILDNDALKFAQMQAEMSGTKLYNASGTSFNYSTQGTQDATLAKAYRHFINYQHGALASTGTFGTSSVSSDSDFPKGNVAVVWYGRWKFAKASWANVNFGVAPPPTPQAGVDANGDGIEDNGSVYCSSVAVGLSVSSRSKNPDLAWKFIRYYMTAGARATLNKGFNLPGNKTIARSDAFLKAEDERVAKLNNWYGWLAEYSHAFTFTKYIDNSVTDGYLKTYLTSASKGAMTVEEALRTAGNKINDEINVSLT